MKIFRSLFVFIFNVFLISGQLFSQDILYRKDSTAVRVNIIEFNGRTVKYQISGDSAGISRYISRSVLDSLAYDDGKSLHFNFKNNNPGRETVKRNFIGVDIINLFKGNPNIWYEYMTKSGEMSLAAELLINANPDDSEGWIGTGPLLYSNFNTHYFFTRIGINYYPYNYSIPQAGDFRFSTGLSLILGSYVTVNWDYYTPESDHTVDASFMWNMDARYYIGKNVQMKAGVDISLLPYLSFFCPQICLSIGF
jgi:hypothetical protein